MPNVIDVKQQATKREEDLLRPEFPNDLLHFDDGTWECSSNSLNTLSRSFQRYGLHFRENQPFVQLHKDFSFIVYASSLMGYLGEQWVKDEQTAEMLAYLAAVQRDDADAIGSTLANVLAQTTLPATPDAPAPAPSRRPTLTLVR